MHLFEEAVRPVLFEQVGDYPYWGKGSSFILADEKHYFWVTAAHVVKSMGGSAETLRIFPTDHSRMSLPFNEKYAIRTTGAGDEEFKDIYMLRIDMTEFTEHGDAPLIAQRAEDGLMPAEKLSKGDELLLIGYAAEHASIDYELGQIKHTRSVVRAVYEGFSLTDHCHCARVETSLNLSSYDGLSGSPVFFLQQGKVGAQDVLLPRIVGMTLRGTVGSSTIHFVSARVINELIVLATTSE